MKPTEPRTIFVYLLNILIFFQAISGIFGGLNLVVDPTGESLGIPVEWLEGSPFAHYLLPGLILLIILGIFPAIVGYGLVKKKRWAWYGSLLVSFGLIIWILVEILIIGYHPQPPLQFTYGIIGILLLVLTLLPAVKKYYLKYQI